MLCALLMGLSFPEPDVQASPERGIFPGRTLYLAAAWAVSLSGWSCIFERLALYLSASVSESSRVRGPVCGRNC